MTGLIRNKRAQVLGLAAVLIASVMLSLTGRPGIAQAAPTAASVQVIQGAVQTAATYNSKKGPNDGKGMILDWSGCPGDPISLELLLDLIDTAHEDNVRMKFTFTDECVREVASWSPHTNVGLVDLNDYARDAKQQVISGGAEGKVVTGAVCNPKTAKQRARKAAVHHELDAHVVVSGYYQPVNGKIDAGTRCEIEQLELTVWTWSSNPLAKDKHGKKPSLKTVIKRVAASNNTDTVNLTLNGSFDNEFDSPLASGASLERIRAALPKGTRLCRINGKVDNRHHGGEGALPVLHC